MSTSTDSSIPAPNGRIYHPIARAARVEERVFATISPDLYAPPIRPAQLAPDQSSALELLQLANKKLTRIQRLAGWNLTESDKISRLLFLHRQAMQAEMAGKWERANQFWELAHDYLKSLAPQTSMWESISCQLKATHVAEILGEPTRLRQCLTWEVFIDAHCAFYNAYLLQTDSLALDNRALVHFNYLKSLFSCADLTAADYLDLLWPASEEWLGVCKKTQSWDQGLRICEDLLKYLPTQEVYLEWWGLCFLGSILAKRQEGKSERSRRKDVKYLRQQISHAELIRQQHPYSLSVLSVLAHLHHQLAISLANCGDLADSLVEVQKALSYEPENQEFFTTRSRLIDLMQGLQQQMKIVQEKLRQRHNVRLTAQGVRMMKEANRGFEPLRRFPQSREARDIQTAYLIAHGRTVWRVMGLPAPTENWDTLAHDLAAGLGRIATQQPTDPAALSEAWENVIAELPSLSILDKKKVLEYLNRRLFASESIPAAQPDRPSPPAIENPPIMSKVSDQGHKGGESFAFWLFGRRDKRLKLQAALALILILMTGGLVAKDFAALSIRDDAYAQVVQAYGRADDLAVIVNAERYLENPPIVMRDERKQNVMRWYTETFVHWFARLEGEIDAGAKSHIDQFQALSTANSRTAGGQP